MDSVELEIATAASALGTWSVIGLIRTAWPGLWHDVLRKRLPKLALVAATAVSIGGIAATGIGLPLLAAAKVSAVAFSAAVTLRQLTKASDDRDRFDRYFDGNRSNGNL